MIEQAKGINLVWLSKTGLTNLNAGEGGTNLIDVKKYKYQGRDYPYVSGQAMRFYLKEMIRRETKPGEACIPDREGRGCGRVDSCVLCDLFGFMIPELAMGANIRVSPVKVSTAMGLLPFEDNSVMDFLLQLQKYREPGEKMEPTPVSVELGINVYKAGVSIDLVRVGAEEEALKIGETPLGKGEKAKPIHGLKLKELVDPAEKKRRIRLLLEAVKSFSDYSKQARLLTDFTPDLILISIQDRYSHRLQKALELKKNSELNEDEISLNTQRMQDILKDIKPYSKALFAGVVEGTIEKGDEFRKSLRALGIEVTTPGKAIDNTIEALKI